jgi:hypothetical protein
MFLDSEREEEEIIALAEEEKYEDIRDIAISELSEAFNYDEDDVDDIEISLDGEQGTFDEDSRTITVPEDPNLEIEEDWVTTPFVQGSVIFEEVSHILTKQDVYEQEHGEHRKAREDYDLWENSANEALGSIPRWGQKWSFERSYEKARNELEDFEASQGPSELYNTLVHFIGYQISEEASEREEIDASELGRMPYDAIKQEFQDKVNEVRTGLAEEYGIFVDFDADVAEGDFFAYIEREDDVISYGQHDGEVDWWIFDEVPEEARPNYT